LGKATTFLLDTGCTTNLLGWRLFDNLGARGRASLEPYEGVHGTLADESCIPFYGIIMLPGHACDQVIHETFIASHLKKDAILGMPFLENRQCHMDYQKSAVVMARKEVAYVDKCGRRSPGSAGLHNSRKIPGYSSM